MRLKRQPGAPSPAAAAALARLAALSAAMLVAACASGPAATGGPLRIASWNLEHLSEDGAQGCRPRTDADYARLRGIATELNADVVAFQEVESARAAERVFDPGVYNIVIEDRPAGVRFPCRGLEGRTLTRQAVGFAIRKGLAVERAADLADLRVGDPNLRGGVDITIRRGAGGPIRLLAVHLKSGCASGSQGESCETLRRQVPVLERWIDARATEPVRFAVLGDFNRRLARSGDPVWADIDDGEPLNADLFLAADGKAPRCDPRFGEFIDHIVLDRRARDGLLGFEELTYGEGERPSDRCPIVALVR